MIVNILFLKILPLIVGFSDYKLYSEYVALPFSYTFIWLFL